MSLINVGADACASPRSAPSAVCFTGYVRRRVVNGDVSCSDQTPLGRKGGVCLLSS